MNIKQVYGHELKKYVLSEAPPDKIGSWAFSFYWNHIEEIDISFRDLLMTLSKMELGPEFSYNYEELMTIAENLINDEDVVL